MKILAIDDDQDNLTMLQAVAQNALPGSHWLTASDGARGLALAQAEDPEVILLDPAMPDMDGFEVCRRLKADAQLSSIPVVFLTALQTDRESRIRALEAGAEAFLSKPIDKPELIAQIRAMVRLKAASRMERMEKEKLAALVAERTLGLERELAERERAEAALRENEAKFRSLYDAMTEGVALHQLVCDAAGRAVDYLLLDANPAFETITGLRRPAVIGRLASEIYGGEAPYLETYAAVVASGRPIKFETEYRPMQKTFVISVFAPAKGQFATVFADITEGKRIQAVQSFLAQTSSSATVEPFFNALARFLAENLGMNFVCIDRLEGDGLNARTVAVWHDGKFEDNLTYALKDTPCGDVVGQQVCCFPAKVCQLFPNDPVLQELRAESYAGLTLFDHAGRPIGLIAVISRAPLANCSLVEAVLKIVAARAGGELARQQAEESLRASEERFKRFYEQSPLGYQSLNADGCFLDLNPAWERMLGYRREEVLGAWFGDYLVPDQTALLHDRFPGFKKLGQVNCVEFEMRHKNGGVRTIAFDGRIEYDEQGAFKRTHCVLNDITEQKRLEAELRQAQKMESIGHLAGGVAHDFNNILASQLLQIGLLQDGDPTPGEIAEGLQLIRADTERAAKLVRQLLLFSRRQVMQSCAVNLNEIVNHIGKLLQRLIGEDIQIHLRLHPAPPNLFADPGMLEQLIVNLATNARDAMPKGGQLFIQTAAATLTEADVRRLKAEAGPGVYVCLSVGDTGTGIPPELLPRIFEPFFTTKEVGKGTGLGLASVFGIVKQHKGGIDVDNRPGAGVAFHVYLPALAVAAPATPPGLAADPPRVRGGAETILLVEDEDSVRHLTARLLKSHGYQVLSAANGVAALELWRRQRDAVSLLFTDLVLPEGINGAELAGRLRAEKPELKVLYASGYSQETVTRRLDMNVTETFIQKPFFPDQLLETIRRCLDGESPPVRIRSQ